MRLSHLLQYKQAMYTQTTRAEIVAAAFFPLKETNGKFTYIYFFMEKHPSRKRTNAVICIDSKITALIMPIKEAKIVLVKLPWTKWREKNGDRNAKKIC